MYIEVINPGSSFELRKSFIKIHDEYHYERLFGEWSKQNGGRGPRKFRFSPKQVKGLRGLKELLAQLQEQTSAALIRGRLRPDARTTKFITRSNETIEDYPAEWACIDIDKYELDDEDDPTTKEGRLEIIKSLITKLPRAFHLADFIYKWSSSAFLKIINIILMDFLTFIIFKNLEFRIQNLDKFR